MNARSSSSDRRHQILDAAQAVFEANGYAQTTIDAVAEKADVSKGNIYNYFQGKRDLFLQLFDDAMASDGEIVDRLLAEQVPASEKLSRLLAYVFGQLERFSRISRLMLEFWAMAAREDHDGQLAASLERAHARGREHIESILRQGIENGEFGQQIDPRATASLIQATVNGVIIQAIFDPDASVNENNLVTYHKGLLAGLGPLANDHS